MIDRILVPIDDSDEAQRALAHAADVARGLDVAVHVLAVVDVRELETAPDAGPSEERARERVAAAVDERDGSLEWTTAVRTGIPDEAIRGYATEADVDLVVMGTHGRTGVRRFVLGSTTEKVVRLSDVPVLTVRADPDGSPGFPYEDVLVPTDGSDGALAAVGPAADLATAAGATVHAVSVVDTRSLGTDVRSDLLVDDLEARCREAVGDLADELRSRGVRSVETAVGHGTPYEALRTYVEDHGVDLVAMGTHGRAGIERYLLGSVTEKLVRTAPAHVLTVRMPDEGA